MGKSVIAAAYLLAMVVTVVLVDIAFFRHHFWARLMANVGIVLIYISFYVTFIWHR